MKTRLRKNAKADCEKIFLKLRNKSVFERIRENVRKLTTSNVVRKSYHSAPRHFHVLFQCNFADQKLHVVSTSFFDVILMIEISTLFPYTFFDVISIVERFTFFPLAFIDVILMFEKSTLFVRSYFDEIQMDKIFWLSCKLMKTFEEVFLCQ